MGEWAQAEDVRDHLIDVLIAHWEAATEPCRVPQCVGQHFDGHVEAMDADELRAALHASVYYLARLRTLPGA